jgi:hypothetical protein
VNPRLFKRPLHWRILKEDSGLALTESVIVMPIILLFFFAMLQYVVIARTAPLVNYAAYAAARSYAVHASVDGSSKAANTAHEAAALALAPVAGLVPGEIKGLSLPTFSTPLLRIGEGYFVAYARLSKYIGGSITIKTNSTDPAQIEVEVLYPQPIYMPGLNELWSFVSGTNTINKDLYSLGKNLKGVIGTSSKIEHTLEKLFGSVLGDYSSLLTTHVLPYPYVGLVGKCAMGYEDWGSKEEYRPRVAKEGDDGAVEDNDAEEELKKIQEAQENVENAQDNLKEKQEDLHDATEARKKAEQAVADAQQEYNNASTTAEKNAAAAKLDAAKQALEDAKEKEQEAKDALKEAQENLNEAVEELTNLGST